MLTREAIARLAPSLVVAELKRSRRENFDRDIELGPGTYLLERHAPAGAPCLGLDSLERLSVAAALSQFFCLREWGQEEALLRLKTLGDIAEFLAEVLLDEKRPWQRLTVASSGTTGEAKKVTHERVELAAEVESWREMLPGVRRVVSLIPPHHLYGLVWTVLLPGAAGWEVEWVRSGLSPQMREGDLVVAVPFQWELLSRTVDRFPGGVVGVSSAGVLPSGEWRKLQELGLGRILEVYGSTETGGVAYREGAGEAYRWAAHARREVSELPDEVALEGEDCFRILRRKDGQVKVGGQLVDAREVEALLREQDGVAECQVRMGQERLEALVIPEARMDWEVLRQKLETEWASRLPEAARPRRITLRAELPRNEMGKVAEW